MLNKDSHLLEEAYLSISKKTATVPSDKETVTTEPNEVVSAGPMDEPAPGVSMDMIDSEVEDVEPEDKDTTGVPVTMVASEEGDCEEAHEMALDNLNSIRESIMKIASHCASGNHLESWAQQKLAIAMDGLAGVARSLR
jgi:hypothetical protein